VERRARARVRRHLARGPRQDRGRRGAKGSGSSPSASRARTAARSR
jgi:hypothetical protein